jgi:hypothetical protein
MQLGQLLDNVGDHIPLVCEPVTFWLNTRDSEGRVFKVKVRALLAPVSEPEKVDCMRQAEQWLRSQPDYAEKDGKLPAIPAIAVSEEIDIRFLCMALRDIDNSARPLVETANYARFRLGLTAQVSSALHREYKAFMSREYPDIVSDTQMRQLEEQAKGK